MCDETENKIENLHTISHLRLCILTSIKQIYEFLYDLHDFIQVQMASGHAVAQLVEALR